MKITKHLFDGNGKKRTGYEISDGEISRFIHPENYDEHYNDTVVDEGMHLGKEALEMFLTHNFTDGAKTLSEALEKEAEYKRDMKNIIDNTSDEDLSDV